MKRGWYYLNTKDTISDATAFDLIKKPIITEKSTKIGQFGQVVFEVALSSNKRQIKQAIEKIYKVNVLNVNTIVSKGKNVFFKGRKGKRADKKKAIVAIKEGQFIDVSTEV